MSVNVPPRSIQKCQRGREAVCLIDCLTRGVRLCTGPEEPRDGRIRAAAPCYGRSRREAHTYTNHFLSYISEHQAYPVRDTPVKQELHNTERRWTVGIRASCPRPTSRSASALAG